MSEDSQQQSRHEAATASQPQQVGQPPAEALKGYPAEASPEPDDSTEPVQVVGEQTDPARRLDVFPEDEGDTASG